MFVMQKSKRLLTGISAIAFCLMLATCCKTLVLTVTKRAPAPRPGNEIGAINDDPIPRPIDFTNRFGRDCRADKAPERARRFSDYFQGRSELFPTYVGDTLDALDELHKHCAGNGEPIDYFAEGSPQHNGTLCLENSARGIKIIVDADIDLDVVLVRVRTPGEERWHNYPIRTIERESVGSQDRCDQLFGSKEPPPDAKTVSVILVPATQDTSSWPLGVDIPVELTVTSKPVFAAPVLSFVHLSDVQLRDSRIKLGDEVVSRRLDNLVTDSFEHNPEQEHYGVYLFESVIKTINAFLESASRTGHQVGCEHGTCTAGWRPPPAFLMHTGDSVDAGVTSEFDMFHRIMDTLRIPWFNVIGNHDVLVFGNLVPGKSSDCVSVQTVLAGQSESAATGWLARLLLPNNICVKPRILCQDKNHTCRDEEFIAKPEYPGRPQGTYNKIDEFVHIHRHDQTDNIKHLSKLGSTQSWYHGFDFNVPRSGLPRCKIGSNGEKECPGYYFFKVPLYINTSNDRTSGDSPGANTDVSLASLLEHLRTWIHESLSFLPPSADASEQRSGPSMVYSPSEVIRMLQKTTDEFVYNERHAIFIALNTDDLEQGIGGKSGWLTETQIEWLDRVLTEQVGLRDLVFIFGHHSLSTILGSGHRGYEERDPRGDLMKVLARHERNIIAYFYGHSHQHGLCRNNRTARHKDGSKRFPFAACEHFWEIETGSILEFPHEARLITMKYLGDGLAYLELIPFSEQLKHDPDSEFYEFVQRAKLGARRDYCRKHDCDSDELPRRKDGDHTFARTFFALP